MTEPGLMTSLSAYLGAVPCVASKIAIAVADVGSGSDAESAHLRGAGVGDVVAVEVGRGQHAVFVGARDDLLEDGVGNAIVDHQLLLPRALAVGGVDGVEAIFHFFVEGLAEIIGREFQARFDLVGILLDGEIRILVFVVDDPALTLGDDLVAELLGGDFVSPLAECAFGEFLDVAFVDQRDRSCSYFRARAGWPCARGAWCR